MWSPVREATGGSADLHGEEGPAGQPDHAILAARRLQQGTGKLVFLRLCHQQVQPGLQAPGHVLLRPPPFSAVVIGLSCFLVCSHRAAGGLSGHVLHPNLPRN